MDKVNSYNSVSKFLHWTMAVLIMLELLVAYLLLPSKTELLKPIAKSLYFLHFNIGFTILILLVVRVIWKLMHPAPKYTSLHVLEIKFAHYGHIVLYVLLGIMVITGVLRYNIHSGDFLYLNTISIPSIISSHNMILYSVIVVIHNLCGVLLVATVSIHIAMAIKHHVIDKNEVLLRMLPKVFHKS